MKKFYPETETSEDDKGQDLPLEHGEIKPSATGEIKDGAKKSLSSKK